MTIRMALVGFGKIARDEHLPAIAANSDFELVAVVTPGDRPEVGCAVFRTLADMRAAMPDGIDAVAICTPPAERFAIAGEAIAAGIAILLEKPPAATLGELDDLILLAGAQSVPVFTAWHSQHAAGVAAAAHALRDDVVASLAMIWCEDVRKYHAGQTWIWNPGGFGVFDPGINGLSILTRILPEPLLVRDATLLFPSNKQAPIAADLIFRGDKMTAVMDWRGDRDEQWSIRIVTASGKAIELVQGGAKLAIGGVPQNLGVQNEYRAIYAEFAKVVTSRSSKVDREPLRIVADCFLVGERTMIEDFV